MNTNLFLLIVDTNYTYLKNITLSRIITKKDMLCINRYFKYDHKIEYAILNDKQDAMINLYF